MALPTPGTGDTYTSGLNAGILAPVSAAYVTNPSGTVTITPGSTVVWRYSFGVALSVTFAVNNPANDGQLITFWLNVGTAVPTITWPSTFRWNGNAAPSPAASSITQVTLRWDAPLAKWYELYRSTMPT